MAIGDFAYLEAPFDEIPDAVVEGRAEAGLLIHEGQLTYGAPGSSNGSTSASGGCRDRFAAPARGDVARRDVERLHELSEVLRRSIEEGLENRDEAMRYAIGFGRGLDSSSPTASSRCTSTS